MRVFLLSFGVALSLSSKTLPIIDISPLLGPCESDTADVIAAISRACEETGFFYITGHGVSEALQQRLQLSSRRFFALSEEAKRAISMDKGGKAWRGYFSVGQEITSGVVDQKEGIYFGQEAEPADPRPLHGPNLFPDTALGPQRFGLHSLVAR